MIVTIKKREVPEGRGGTRPGAGRPTAHTMQLLVRVKPATAEKLKELSEKLNQKPGQLLDQCLSAAESSMVAHTLAILRSELNERRRFSLKTAQDLKKQDPVKAAEFASMADGLAEALRMVDEKLEDR